MRYEQVDVTGSEGDGVRTLVLPGGALTARTAAELLAATDALVEDRSARVVVVRSRSEDFCTGPAEDLDPLAFPVDPAAALARLRPPVVVAVRGACRSVGLEIALAGDIRIATPDARFCLPDVGANRLPCWGGTQRLPRAVGTTRAVAMVLLGDELDAAGARRAGLVSTVADPEDHSLAAAVDATVAQLLGCGPLALELAKEAVHRGSELPLRDGLRLEGDLNHLLQTTDDRAEGLAAFFAKRPPDFAGR